MSMRIAPYSAALFTRCLRIGLSALKTDAFFNGIGADCEGGFSFGFGAVSSLPWPGRFFPTVGNLNVTNPCCLLSILCTRMDEPSRKIDATAQPL